MTDHHHAGDVAIASCLVIVISDTRTLDTDQAGKAIAERLARAGHRVAPRVLVRDEVDLIRSRVEAAITSGTDVLVLTGGTGITPRDVTPEAVRPLVTRELPGFGEAFRRISYDEVGINGLLSRAFAGLCARTLVFALPGSRRACVTAVDELVVPMIPHALGLRECQGSAILPAENETSIKDEGAHR